VYEENHSTTTSNGLVNLTVGMGNAVNGVFAQIAWGVGNKYLQVLMNNGSGEIDLGTQQMMSVPYALYAEKSNTTNISVSAVGDTLYLGNGNYILIPGISNSNASVETGLGATLLPGVTECAQQTISASGCDGLTELEYQGYTYDLVEIAGQCWFKENLRATSFNDGTPVSLMNTFNGCNSDWNQVTPSNPIPYYGYYNNDTAFQAVYGNLYNSPCLISENICPTGWHVPTKCDFHYLANRQGVSINEINSLGNGSSYGENVYLHGRLLDADTSQWDFSDPRFIPNNSSGFSFKLGGERSGCGDAAIGFRSDFWIYSPDDNGFYKRIQPVRISPEITNPNILFLTQSIFNSNTGSFFTSIDLDGHYIRCIKD
jgi:uncharacterized protein (TIGR02145 family)